MTRAITYCGSCGVRIEIETRRLTSIPRAIPILMCSGCARRRFTDPDILVVEEWMETPAKEPVTAEEE